MFFIGDGSGTWDDNPSAITSAFYESLFPVNARVGSGSWTYVPNSSIVNEFQGGLYALPVAVFLGRPQCQSECPVGPLQRNPDGLRDEHGRNEPALFRLPEYQRFWIHILGGNWPKFVGPDQNVEILDHISYLHGKHAFKFGGEYTYVETNSGATSNAKGRINFKARIRARRRLNPASLASPLAVHFENFLLGNVGSGFRSSWATRFGMSTPITSPLSSRTTTGRPQDSPSTSACAMSWALFGRMPTTGWATSIPTLATGLVQVGDGITSPYNPDHRDWSPRAGFAWDSSGNQKTVIRAGAGLLYEFVPSSAFMNSGGNAVGLGKVPTGGCDLHGRELRAGHGNIAAATFTPPQSGPVA